MIMGRSMWSIQLMAICFWQVSSIIRSPPRIVKQPPTDELLFKVAQRQDENEKPFIIECEAEGEPAPKYQWIKNDNHFDWRAYDDRISQQPGRGTLVIISPRDEDLGQYQCFATNEWGTATSNSVFVRKAELNSFKDVPPITVSAQEGDPFRLICQPPDGWPKPDVFWLIQNFNGGLKTVNNSRITLDPEGNLWFSNVTRDDASDDFQYVCAAISGFSRNEYKVGNRVLLDVVRTGVSASQNRHEPVQQYVTRKNEVALRGKEFELYCIFGGTPLPQTIWSKDGQIIHPSENVTYNNYGKSLVIKHASFEDEGNYTCEASNGVGTAKSYSVNLHIIAVPYFTEEPDIINAAEDETVEFRCKASGIPEPQIKWIHNGRPINEAPSDPRRKVAPNSIIIHNLEKNDTGNYGCNATSILGYVYKDVYINVLSLAPEISDPPHRQQATVDGRTVTLTCRVFGAPKPRVKWIHGGVQLKGGRYTVLENGDLEIREVTFVDAGEYTCYAENRFGEANAYCNLVVKERTRITEEPEDNEVAAGSTVTFKCNAVNDASLQVTIEWFNNEHQIDFDAEPRFVLSSDYSLTITRTTELDSGVYTCVVRTELDEAKAQATLIVQDVPNSPNLKTVASNKRDASIHWEPMGDNRAPILRYTIQFNTSFTPDTWEIAYDSVPATDMTYTVAMRPRANYTFRVIAWNKVGPSLPSQHSAVCCTTQPDVPYNNPYNVEGKGIAPNNIVIRWTPMPEIEHNGPHFMYRVFWRRNIPGEQWVSHDIINWEENKLIIPNQPTFQQYHIKVAAINEMGEANVGLREVLGYSGEGVPTHSPNNFQLDKLISGTSAVFSWDPVPLETVHGNFKGYKIQIWTEKEVEGGLHEIFVREATSNTKTQITRLIPHSKNYARVFVYNGRYNGPSSEVLSFNTPEDVPRPVQFFDAFPLGKSALYLIWKHPEEPNGILTGYRIYFQDVRGTRVGPILEREPKISDPNQTHVILAGLLPGTKYRLHIRATTSAGQGEAYIIEEQTLSQTSAAVIPDKPNFTWNKMSSVEGRANIRVFWLPNINGNPASDFFVKYRKKNETVFTEVNAVLNEEYAIVRDLEPGGVYELMVVSVSGEHETESEALEIEIPESEPSPPKLLGVTCNKFDATVKWKPVVDNHAPVLRYIIEFNTRSIPNGWEVAFDSVPASDMSYTVQMRPWAVYTFRVIAQSKFGLSDPSQPSGICRTEAEVPFKNPDNVEGKGTGPDNLVIRWTPMHEIEHNAPRFMYRVYWKRDSDTQWDSKDIENCKDSKLIIRDQPTFQKYCIKVIAMNDRGIANVPPTEVTGYSGEDAPIMAPDTFAAVAEDTVLFNWSAVPPETVSGHIKGYKLRTWTEADGNYREIDVKGENTSVKVTDFLPSTTYSAQVLVYNSRFYGPPSYTIIFKTHEGVPSKAPNNFKLVEFPNSTSAQVHWDPVLPETVLGHLMGYKIQIWTEKEEESALSEIDVTTEETERLIINLTPYSKYSARILVYNSRHNGPPSETLTFITPEAVPGVVQYFKAFPLGPSALYLIWKCPEQPNGILTGYMIYFQAVKGKMVGPKQERPILDPNQTRVKLTGLRPDTKYKLHIRATTSIGKGEGYVIEQQTQSKMSSAVPDPPNFTWTLLPQEDYFASVEIVWLPNTHGNPGSNFFVKYRKQGETTFKEIFEKDKDYIIVDRLMSDTTYVFSVVSVAGKHSTESEVKEVYIPSRYNRGSIPPSHQD